MTSVSLSFPVIWQELKEKNWTQRIKFLSLKRCQLTEIDPALCALSGLIRLDLSQNQLSYFRGKFPHLRCLNLSENRLQEFPQCEEMSSLKKLNLSRNLIVKLPSTKIGPNVKHVNISRNQIEELPMPFLRGITSLNAEHNLLESFPKRIFSQLTVACLLGNEITSLDLRAIPNVRTLTLSLVTFKIVAERLNLRGLTQVIIENGELTEEDQRKIYCLDIMNIEVTFEESCLNSSNTLL